jgi:hypothetical protein
MTGIIYHYNCDCELKYEEYKNNGGALTLEEFMEAETIRMIEDWESRNIVEDK